MTSALAIMLLSATLGTAATMPCENLASLSLPNTTITSAKSFPAGPYMSQGQGGRQQTGPVMPAHCRVAAVLAPTPDSHIEMEVWLPAEGWNGKFLAVGNGGFAGTISFGAMASGVREGYAAASTDTGHKGDSAAFGVGHPEKIMDFGIRSMHEMTVKSKAIIGAFYDRQPRLSYYMGCSTGGMQGLSEAQRFPMDFDAIVAGAPVNNQTHLHASQIKKMMDIIADERRFVPADKIKMVSKAVMDQCDASDSVRDGFLSDPQSCKFEPAALLCKAGDNASCLTAGQVASLKAAYDDTLTKSGALVYPGHPRGFELNWRMPAIGGEPTERPLGSFRYFGHQDSPGWTWKNFELDTDLALAVKNADYEALSPDLRAFKARGGKLLIYHGLNDPGPSPLNTVNYYEAVRKVIGPNPGDWLRVFMMPGMDHCRGGVGPDQANFLGAMERWVESGAAPDRITVSRVTDNGQVDMTRPLCPYPQFAKWKGAGSTNDAENFTCQAK